MVALAFRRRSFTRLLIFASLLIFIKLLFFPSSSSYLSTTSRNSYGSSREHEIQAHNILEKATRAADKSLDVQRHAFLQSRMGRDERPELFGDAIRDGMRDWWERFQLPFIVSRDTAASDTQHVLSSIEQLLSLNGWVAALCPALVRPFGQTQHASDRYFDLVRQDHLYFIALAIHSADHFLTDQLSVIVQLSKTLGARNLFVSMLDYDSSDSTPTLLDLCEAVLTLLGIPFRIRRVERMTEEALAAYYPLEEAHMRNLALEPLHELRGRRGVEFARVVWLKGFTCPNDILETLKISFANEAAMVCGLDWAEHNGLFVFSDRWRTRDILGDQFRQAVSSSKSPLEAPPRDRAGAARYAKHLPFQVFCCEAGTHVVDPAQSYYKGLSYRAGTTFLNASRGETMSLRGDDAECLDSSQMWFCRDLWVRSARDAMEEVDRANAGHIVRRDGLVVEEVAAHDPFMENALRARQAEPDVDVEVEAGVDAEVGIEPEVDEINEAPARPKPKPNPGAKPAADPDSDHDAGSDYDAMPDDEDVPAPVSSPPSGLAHLSIPNSVFRPARILVNPRCVTTYAGVRHAQLARDLFGDGEAERERDGVSGGKYVLDDWEGAPESFVCQEQRQTGGRTATKTQRRLGFSIHDELQQLHP